MSELRPFWERNKWLIRPAAIVLLIVSPIVFPMMVIVENWAWLSKEVKDCYAAHWDVVIGRWQP